MDQSQLCQYITRYQNLKTDFDTYAKKLIEILNEIAKKYAPLAIVQARAKTVPSFTEKIVRKGYTFPFIQMTDLCGARIITPTLDQMRAVCEIIEKTFIIDVKNSLDTLSRLGTKEFDYLSVHYVIQLHKGSICGVEIPPEILPRNDVPFKAEVQVRTLLQHVWADVFHDRIYKNRMTVPESIKRDVARVAAILEEADKLIVKEASMIDEFIVDIGAFMTKPEIDDELMKLKLIFENENNPKAKDNLALRIAKMYRAISDWDGIINDLSRYDSCQNSDLLRELGNAYCEKNAMSYESTEYKKGQALLEESVRLNSLDAEAHSMLARSHRRNPMNEKLCREHYQKAFDINFKNPYHFADYLEYELLNAPTPSILLPLRPFIESALDTCRQHVRAGIELLKAFLTIGRLSLFLAKRIDSIEGYAQAIALYLNQDSGVCSTIFHDEQVAISRLTEKSHALLGDSIQKKDLLETLKRTLQIANYLNCRDANAKDLLSLRSNAPIPYQSESQVLFVVGGCDERVESEMQTYTPLLKTILARFKGFVIGGGTTSGISGVLGLIAHELKEQRNFELVGYHPSRLATNCEIDRRYDYLIPTPGNDFSLLDTLQAWIDILAAGIPIENIKILAINGGDISLGECYLGVAFGAQTGVIQNSGRSADAILSNPAWRSHKNLLAIPNDLHTIGAFINQGEPTIQDPKKLEEAAEACHENYQEKNREVIYTKSGRPWDILDEFYRQRNRMQISYAGEILNTNGFETVDKENKKQVKLLEFTEEDNKIIEKMAEMEHGRWNIDLIRQGWIYGKEKDEVKKTQPCLIPWKDLSDKVKQYDRNAVRAWPAIFAKAGIEIHRK